MFSWKTLPRPIIALAPMADYIDLPFGLICKKFGAQVIFREMVSTEAILHQNGKTLKMLKSSPQERPVIQQIFGRDPEKMAQAAKMICKISRPDGIDINMGCPVRKVIKNFHGAALMKEPKLAAKIIKAVKNAIKVPVSVKTRLGWSQSDEILSFAPLLEKAGADLISIHGRTKEQGYVGPANWEMIGQVKKILKIPVLANGGIFTSANIHKCLEVTGADGVLIARGALGNPWIFQLDSSPTRGGQVGSSLKERFKIILEHARLQQKHYGDYGMILFRKHLVNYLKGLPHSHELKNQLLRVKTFKELENGLLGFQNSNSLEIMS